jgi:hypothetical protein
LAVHPISTQYLRNESLFDGHREYVIDNLELLEQMALTTTTILVDVVECRRIRLSSKKWKMVLPCRGTRFERTVLVVFFMSIVVSFFLLVGIPIMALTHQVHDWHFGPRPPVNDDIDKGH